MAVSLKLVVHFMLSFVCLCFRSDGLWPQSSVKAEGATLQFLSMTSDLNGEYQCEASNPYGRKHGHLYLHVTSGEIQFDLAVGVCQIVLMLCICSCSGFLDLSLL